MKESTKLIIIFTVILIVVIITLSITIYEAFTYKSKDIPINERKFCRGVIIKVNKDSLGFITEKGDPFYLIYNDNVKIVDFTNLKEKNAELKEGQQIFVAYSGNILNTVPKTIPNIGAIYILNDKQKIDIKIPDNAYDIFQDYYTTI